MPYLRLISYKGMLSESMSEIQKKRRGLQKSLRDAQNDKRDIEMLISLVRELKRSVREMKRSLKNPTTEKEISCEDLEGELEEESD